jgi:hypothetical protein
VTALGRKLSRLDGQANRTSATCFSTVDGSEGEATSIPAVDDRYLIYPFTSKMASSLKKLDRAMPVWYGLRCNLVSLDRL